MEEAQHTIALMVVSRWLRGSLRVCAVVCGVTLAGSAPMSGVADAQPKATLQPVVGANEIMKVTTPAGFVDDVVASDNQRLAYVVADTSTRAELHVVQLGCAKCIEAKQEVVVDLAPVTLRPTSLRLVGQRALVIGTTEDGNQVAALVELASKTAKPVYKLGPATHITLIARDGKPSIAVHKATATKSGMRHDVELFALESGKRLAKGRTLDLDKDYEKKLDLRVNHWSDGWTRAGGLKGGEWVKKENTRSPDTEATYDLIAGKFVDNKPIADLFEQRKRYQTLADAGGQLDFLRMKPDNSAIEIWRRGVQGAITLDQAVSQYDPKSLQGVINADGSAWIALKVDPVNAEAVARKKADPEYLDVFRVGPDGKATRKTRILSKGTRHRFGVVDNLFWLLEKSTGFDRGGRVLTIYQLAS
jgi:hypothetical protein